jgi:hypothetical protein
LRALALVAASLPLLTVPAESAAAQSGREPERESLEHWRKLSEQERAVLQERYARLRAMTPEERARLEERAGTLEELKRYVRERMPDELRRKLESLPPERRSEVMREHMREEMRRRGERIADKLPPAMRAALEAAPPEERERVLHELLRGMRGAVGEPDRADGRGGIGGFEGFGGPDASGGPGGMRALERLAGELELTPETLERLRALPPAERMLELLRLRKQTLLERAARRGRPPHGIAPEEWEALAPLPPPQFFEELSRRAHGGRSASGGPSTDPREAGVRELEEALRPSLEDLIEAAELSGLERMRLVGGRARSRALDVLERRELVPPEELARLAGLDGLELFRALRERFGLRGPRPSFVPDGGRGPGGGRR